MSKQYPHCDLPEKSDLTKQLITVAGVCVKLLSELVIISNQVDRSAAAVEEFIMDAHKE